MLQDSYGMIIGRLQDDYRMLQDGYRFVIGLLQDGYRLLQSGYSMVLDKIVYGWLQDVIGWLQNDCFKVLRQLQDGCRTVIGWLQVIFYI